MRRARRPWPTGNGGSTTSPGSACRSWWPGTPARWPGTPTPARGLGRALLGALLEGCTAAGARQVIAVIADTGQAASTALHEGFGFTPAGRLTAVGRKHGRWVDTILLQRDLTAATSAVPHRKDPGLGLAGAGPG
ncbi:MAG TPA: hypothetical protein VMV07_13930 [Streptosporangiaceae bacterium]|nr:hypothetical protein [Streptosporangiaceae bacterium]